MIRALLFDFDGTLVDTESPAFRAWSETFAEHGHELRLERWVERVGTIGHSDPLADLATLVGAGFDRDAVAAARRTRRDELCGRERLRAGVREWLTEARERGLRVGIVTSADRAWVASHLERLGEGDGWDCIVCAERDATVAKPRPTLYVRALAALGVEPHEAIAVEDSPNGVAAAKAAGIACVAVPNSVTAGLDLSAADLRVESLADVALAEAIKRLG